MQAVPALDLSAIPTAQRAAVQGLMEQVAALTEITRRQEHLIAELNHALHGHCCRTLFSEGFPLRIQWAKG